MNPHRLNTLDIAPTRALSPASLQDPERFTWRDFMVALVVAAAVAAVVIPATRKPEAPIATPVPRPQVQVIHVEPLTVTDARIEGWRAGFAEGQEQSCAGGPVLSHPVAIAR